MIALTWTYHLTEDGFYCVGFEDINGNWHSDSDHFFESDAVDRVAYLNAVDAARGINQ